MLPPERILAEVLNHIDAILADDEAAKRYLEALLKQHPVDIATLLLRLSKRQQIALLLKFPDELGGRVFEQLPISKQVYLLSKLDADATANILKAVHTDSLTELFEHLTDKKLKHYLKLLQKKQRTIIISHLNFAPKSAGRIMDSEVLSLQEDMTIKKSIALLQRLSARTKLLRRIYITSTENVLKGFVNLDELVINKPMMLLRDIVRRSPVVIDAHEDQEAAANNMRKYNQFSAPVVDAHKHFLGVITADDVFDVLEEEASEDVYRMSGLPAVDYSYFDTPARTLVWQRFLWLGSLLVLQSFSGLIVSRYADLIKSHVIITFFMTMLIGTGGNAGNQSATLVIRGLATGEIKRKHGLTVLAREFCMSLVMAALLVVVGFFRVVLIHHDVVSAIAISISLFLIVVASMVLGTVLPLILERLNIDPAHSAAPFLATVMDVLGMLIYCLVCSKILS